MSETDHVPGNVAPISPAMIFTSPLHPHPIGLYTEEECRAIRPTNMWCDTCSRTASGAAFLCVDEKSSSSSSSPVHQALFCFKCVVQANQKETSTNPKAAHMFQIEAGNASHTHRLSAVTTLPPHAYPSPHKADGDQPLDDTQTFTCAFCHREQMPAGHYRCAGANGSAAGSSADACLFDVCISCVASHLKSGGWTIALMTAGPNAFNAEAPTIKEKQPVMQLHVVTKNVQDKPPTFAARALGLCSAAEIRSAAPALQTCAACENTVLGCGFLSIPKVGKPEDADGPIFCSRCVFESDEKSSPSFRKALRHPKHEHQLQNTWKLREGEAGFKCLLCTSETKRVGHYSCKHPGCKTDICIDCAHATLLSDESSLEKVELIPPSGEVSTPAEKVPEGKLLDKSAPAEKPAESKSVEKPAEVQPAVEESAPAVQESKQSEETKSLATAATSSSSHPAELIPASVVAANHKKLPLHLQLCSFCLVSTVVYNCPQCITAMVDPLSCGTCYRTNHMSAKMKSHQATRQVVQGVDEAVTQDDRRSKAQAPAIAKSETIQEDDEDYSLDQIETTAEEIKSEPVVAATLAPATASTPATTVPVPTSSVPSVPTICSLCDDLPSTLACANCKMSYCDSCDADAHATEKTKVHVRTRLAPPPAAPVSAPVVAEVKQQPVTQPAKPPVVEEKKVEPPKRQPVPAKAAEPVLAPTPKRSTTPEALSEPVEEEPEPEPVQQVVKKKKSKKKKVSMAAEPPFEDQAAREAEQARLLAEWEALHYANTSNSKKKKKSSKKKKGHIPPFPDTSRAGMLEHVFALLSQERIIAEEEKRPPALKGFDLPFSVLFHNSNPHSTLSTDSDGFVKQLQWGSSPVAKTEAVLERFLNTPISGPNAYTVPVQRNPDDAVALCFSATNNTDALALNTAQLKLLFGIVEPEAEHSDPSNVGSQHSAERPRGNFLLQRFIPSPGAHSTMYRVRADWIGLDESDPPALTLSVCTNPNGREDSKRSSGQLNLGVPISHALAVKNSSVKEVAFNYDARDSMSPQFQRLCTQMRDSIAALGMGRPIRLSLVVAPSRKIDALSGADEESIGEESAFEEKEQMDAGSSSEYKWHFCFADLIQLQSVETALPPPSAPAENAAAVASPEPAAPSPTSSPTTNAKKEKPRKSIKLTQAVVPRKILHDATECGKCNRVFLSRDESHLIYLKQVLLKWVPNSLFEYPEDLFHNLLGVDNQREADWYKCVIKICGDCRDEIRSLKTIPSRTQLAPWLKAAADSSIIATPKVDDSQPVTLLALPPTTAVLPYLAKAPVLHPDAPGFAGILSPPKAETTHKKTKKPMSDLLYPSESAAIAASTLGTKYHAAAVAQMNTSKSSPSLRMIHPIAGGAGTAPAKPHHPKSRHHRSDMSVDAVTRNNDDDYADEEDESKRNNNSYGNGSSNGNGAFLPSLSKQASAPVFSPFSSGQKRPPPVLSDSPPPTNAGLGPSSSFTYGYESAQDLRERERERALAKAMKQNKMISPTQPYQQQQQQQMRRAQSQGTLMPLSSSPPKGGAHFVAPLQKKESMNSGYASPPPANRSSPSPHGTPPLQPLYSNPGSPMHSKSVPQNVLASNQRQGSVPNRVERAEEEDDGTIEEIEEYPEEKFD